MSKLSVKTYAKALVGAIGNKKSDTKKITDNFLKLLEKNQDSKKVDHILAMAETMLLEKSGNKKVLLETARKIDTKDFVKTFVKKGDSIEEKINPGIIAGIKVTVNNDKQLDLSLAKKLENIFNSY